MIPYGKNGKIEASFLLTEIVGTGLVCFPDEKIRFDGVKHEITGAVFSERVRNFPEIRENFRAVVSDLLSLYEDCENDASLRVPAELLGGDLLPYVCNEPLTGITLLNLFSKKVLKLEKTAENGLLLSAGLLFGSALERPENLLNSLSERLMLFDGVENFEKQPEIRFLSTEMTCETPEHFVHMKTGAGPFSVSYEQEEGIERYVESGLTTEEELNRTMEAGEWTRTVEPDEKTVSAMKTLRNIFDEMADVSQAVFTDDSKYSLSYQEGKTRNFDHMSIRIPDGFSVTEEEGSLILFLPNAENPEEWEASVFMLLTEGTEKDTPVSEKTEIRSVYDGSTCQYRIRQAIGDDALLLRGTVTGVTPSRRSDADRMIREILSGFRKEEERNDYA